MKKWLTAVLFGTVLALAACGGGGDDGATDGGDATAVSGEEVYTKSCASCHGDDLSGGAGPALDAIGNDMSADEIEQIIEDGAPGMPGGLVSGDDATAVSEWLAEQK